MKVLHFKITKCKDCPYIRNKLIGGSYSGYCYLQDMKTVMLNDISRTCPLPDAEVGE